MAIFKKRQKLEITDNTGKPINKVQIVEVLDIEGTPEEPEYFLAVMNPDLEEIQRHGLNAYTAHWQLDRAVLDHKIFVKILS